MTVCWSWWGRGNSSVMVPTQSGKQTSIGTGAWQARLLFRPLTGTSAAPPSIGIACATKGDVTPAVEKFYGILQRLTGTCRRIINIKSVD